MRVANGKVLMSDGYCSIHESRLSNVEQAVSDTGVALGRIEERIINLTDKISNMNDFIQDMSKTVSRLEKSDEKQESNIALIKESKEKRNKVAVWVLVAIVGAFFSQFGSDIYSFITRNF